MKRACICVLLAVLCLFQGKNAEASVSCGAAAAAVYDPLTATFFYEKNGDAFRGIASTTKIMTALVVLETADLDDTVTVSPAAAAVEGSRMGLQAGQRVTVRTLLYGLMLSSGNDAALALAEHCGGTENFVGRMNAKAAELGLTSAHFENPHGLDGTRNGATAKELCLLMAAAMEHPAFREITAAETYHAEGFWLHNHNRLLGTLEGACGGKTGYTRACGRCLVSCVERCGRMMILVTLNDPDDWADHTAMADAFFAPMREVTFCEKGQICTAVPVTGGCEPSAEIVPESTIRLFLTPEEAASAQIRCMVPRFVYAPVRQSAVAGSLRVYLDNRELGNTFLLYGKSVGKNLAS